MINIGKYETKNILPLKIKHFHYILSEEINEKNEKRSSTITSQNKRRISRLSKININEKKNLDKLPEDIKQIFNNIKNTLFPKWVKNSYIHISSGTSNEENIINKKNNVNKSFKAFFGPFPKKYVFKKYNT